MGKNKVKTVGGGAAKPVADQYSQFLGSGMNAGQFGNPASSTQGFAGGINTLLHGAPGDPLSQQGLYQSINNLGQLSNGGNIPQQQGMMPTSNYNQMGAKNIGSPGSQGYDPGLAAKLMSNQNPQQVGLPQQVGSSFGGPSAAYMMNQFGQQANLGQGIPNMGLATQGMDPNNQMVQAMQQQMGQQQGRDIADLRSRFSAGGGMSMGTPAAVAEGLYRANAAPNIAAMMGNMNMQQQGLNTQSFGAMANAGLGQRGQDLTNFTQNRGLDINQVGQWGNLMNQNNALNQQGQIANNQFSQNAQMANQNAGLQGQQMYNNNLQALMGNQAQNRGMDIQSMLGTGNLGLQTLLGTWGANNQAGQQNIQNQLQNQGQQANAAAQQGQLALGNQGQDMQSMMGIIQQLMGQYGQTQALGTPQAGLVQQPSGFNQFLQGVNGVVNTVGNIKNAISPFGSSGQQPNAQMSGGGGMGANPNFQMPNVNQFPGGVMGGFQGMNQFNPWMMGGW